MQLSENARRVLEARYLRRDAQGKISEAPYQLFARVAGAIAHAELLLGNWEQSALWEERFYQLLTSLDFLPNSPSLMNAGTPPAPLRTIRPSISSLSRISRPTTGTWSKRKASSPWYS